MAACKISHTDSHSFSFPPPRSWVMLGGAGDGFPLSLPTRHKDSHVVELPPKPWPKKKRSFLNPSGRYEQFEHEKGLARHLTKLHLNDKRVSGHSLKKNETNILGYKKELKIVIRAACPSKISIEWKVQKKSTEVHVADGSDESGEEDDDA